VSVSDAIFFLKAAFSGKKAIFLRYAKVALIVSRVYKLLGEQE